MRALLMAGDPALDSPGALPSGSAFELGAVPARAVYRLGLRALFPRRKTLRGPAATTTNEEVQ